MARKKYPLGQTRDPRNVEELVVETFTHRQPLADGRVIFADPSARFWMLDGSSWYGVPPKEWDAARAAADGYTHSYECVSDYS